MPEAPFGSVTPAATQPRARTLGCEAGGQTFDLLLVGDELFILHVGKAEGGGVDPHGFLLVLHWVAVLISKVGARRLARGHPDSSPGDTGAAIGRARMRYAAVAPARLLALDPASLRATAAELRARRIIGEVAEAVELHGMFASAAEPAPRKRTVRLTLAGDPFASIERLLGMAGVRIAG